MCRSLWLSIKGKILLLYGDRLSLKSLQGLIIELFPTIFMSG